ncbi:MAG: Cna B-type domain-containing protein, partial [Erysipelothrix sp.]|nr:Cna B-type domain-containing protein [Erysipelothrix sp.]
RTTVDDTNNLDHKNEVTLDWQGGEETTDRTVAKRDAGITKSGEVVINEDGSKTVNWTIKFNTKKNVIHNFELTDTYTPASVTVSNIKIKSGDDDVTEYFTISDETTGGEFTVNKDQLKAQEYTLTYSTTLSPEEERAEITNTADITYTGGSDEIIRTVSIPELKVEKQADKIIRPTENNINPLIEWTIYANTDSKNKFVNLVDAILEDTIPLDQKLVSGSVKAVRTDDINIKIDGTKIAESAEYNSFRIELPNGPYQYTITYQTEILQLPSLDGEIFDKYNNTVTLTNQTKNQDLKQDDKADAWIRYYGKLDNDLTGKTGSQNSDTENIDYEVIINPEGLTIHNAKIKDSLSDNHVYIKDSIKLFDKEDKEISGGFNLVVAENKRSFSVTFFSDSNSTGTIDSKYIIKYSTRLNDNLIGTHKVKNDIEITGGTPDKTLSETSTTTTAQQWFYGGGGSGRTLKLEVNKFDNKVDNPEAIEGVVFKLERANLNGSLTEVDAKIETNENGIFIKDAIRAGRYILTEVSAPGLYQKLKSPVHFLIGYTNPDDINKDADGNEINPYTITIVDANWNIKKHSHASAEGNVLTIVNDFVPVSHQFVATKTLTGSQLVDNEFEFILLDANREEIDRVKNDANGRVTFNPLTFSQPGTYKFSMKEVQEDRKGMSYDQNEYDITLTIGEGKDGLIVYLVDYENENQTTGNNFENNYQPLPTELALTANKGLTGRDIVDGEFTFEVYATDSDNEVTGEVINSATNDADGLVEFESITYTEVGIYNYVMVEVFGDKDTVTYDETKIYFTVTVRDNEGQLEAVLEIDNQVDFIFGNIYMPHPADLELEIIKKLIASSHPLVGGRELVADEFNFEVVDAATENIIVTATNDANGKVGFLVEDYFKEVGEHRWTIREIVGDDSTIDYATNEINVSITVTDEEGQLTAFVEYDEVNPTFVNIEKTYAIGDYTWIDANKDGIQDEDELVLPGVIVELYDAEGKKIDETTTDSKGLYIFDELVAGNYKVRFVLTEEQAKIYEFTQEVTGEESTNNSDANPITGWTVDIVLDDENKHLTKSYADQELLATQGIDPTWDAGVVLRTRIDISVEKIWSGGPDEKDSVFVQLYRNGIEFEELIELSKANDWTYTWTDLYVTDKNREVYAYTIKEVKLDNYSVEITGDIKDGFLITNTYVIPTGDVTAKKVWVGGPVVKPTVEFQLLRDGKDFGDVILLKNGTESYTWKDLELTDVDGKVYTYTVKEVDVHEDYDMTISEDGLTITNTHYSSEHSKRPGLPATGISNDNILFTM